MIYDINMISKFKVPSNKEAPTGAKTPDFEVHHFIFHPVQALGKGAKHPTNKRKVVHCHRCTRVLLGFFNHQGHPSSAG
jgi:hypothetical protein